MAVKVEMKSSKTTKYEGTVRVILSQLPSFSDSISGAWNAFNYDLQRIPRMSVGAPSCFYKSVWDDAKKFTVWHLNAKGDKDRIVAIVTEQ